MQQQPLELKKKKKKREKTSASKKKKKSEGLVEKKSPTGPQVFPYELEEEDIASVKNYLRMDPDTFNAILERITPRIRKLTINYKKPIF